MLDSIVTLLHQRERIVEAQRTERRVPDQAEADRGADRAGIRGGRERFTGHVKGGRTFVVHKRANVRENRAFEAGILGQEGERRLRLKAGAPVQRAAQRILVGAGSNIARTNAGRGEAANQVRSHLEMIQHAQVLAAPAGDMAALEMQHGNDVGEHLVVAAGVDGRTDEVDVAAGAGEVLFELGVNAGGRVPVVVEGVIGDRVTQHRDDNRARRELFADGQRGFTVGVTVTAIRAKRFACRVHARSTWLYQGVGGELTVVEGDRQRDLLRVDVVARLERKLFAQCKPGAGCYAKRLAVVRNVVGRQRLFGIKVDADAEAIAHEERLRERQFQAARVLAILQRGSGVLALTEQIALRDAELGHPAAGGRIPA